MRTLDPSPSRKPKDTVDRGPPIPSVGSVRTLQGAALVTVLLAAWILSVGAETMINVTEHCVERSLGPVCDFREVDDVVVLSGERDLPVPRYLEMEIHNAVKGVHIYPSCISWVQIYNSINVSTRAELDNSCRTWLRAYNSSLDYVAHGVKDLTLYGSSVQEVRLTDQRDFTAINSTIAHVKDVSWKGYPGIIRNSTLRQISKMTVRDDFSVSGSHIGKIGSRAISIQSPRTTEIVNSTVGLIESKGLSIDSNFVVVKLINVTIGELASHAFMVTSNSKLHFENVTISRAVKPIIRTLFPESITMDQVTIEGEPVTSINGLYDATLGLDFNLQDSADKLDLSFCKSNETTYECNLSNKDPVVIMVPSDIETLVLRGGSSILLENSSCPHNLILESHRFGLEGAPLESISLAALLSVAITTPKPSSSISHCDLTLDATMSEIDVLDGAVSTLRIRDSVVHSMRLENVMDVTLTNTTVANVHKMVIRDDTKSSFTSVSISNILGLELQAGTVLENLKMKMIKPRGLTVDHDGQTSVVRGVNIMFLEDSSVTILQGNLLLEDVTIVRSKPRAFNLSRDTVLELHNVSFTFQNPRLFFVHSLDQVKINQVKIGEELMDTMDESRLQTFFHVYGHDHVFGDDVILLSKDKTNCNQSPYISVYCDFSQVSETPVILDGEPSNLPQLIISNARNLIVLPTCHRDVVISNTLNGATLATPSTCTSWFSITNSTFANLTAGFHGLAISDSTVKLLAPEVPLKEMYLVNMTAERVEGLTWEDVAVSIEQSQIGVVAGMQGAGSFVYVDTHIDTIESDGMTFNADTMIKSCTIDVIKTSGILLTKNLMIKNSTIRRLERRAIVSHGILILNNVTILESDEESIVASDKGGVAFYDVTVGGQRVHWVGYIAGKDDVSAIFLNKKKQVQAQDGDSKDEAMVPEDADASGKKIAVVPATTQASSELPIQPQVVVSASATRRAAATPVPETSAQIDNLEVPAQSLTWTGVGVGLLVGLLCSVAMVAIYVACSRSGRGRMLGPVMSWRSAEDRDELLVNDLSDVSTGGEAAASASTTSSGGTDDYQQVPRADNE